MKKRQNGAVQKTFPLPRGSTEIELITEAVTGRKLKAKNHPDRRTVSSADKITVTLYPHGRLIIAWGADSRIDLFMPTWDPYQQDYVVIKPAPLAEGRPMEIPGWWHGG